MAERSNPRIGREEISLRELLLHISGAIRFLFSKWKIILICAFIGLLAGLAYAFLSETKYSATISFVTDTNQNGSATMSSYAGLAAAFGLNLGNNGLGNSLFSGDNIYDLMKTRRMLENTLLTPVNIDGKKTLLIDRYIQMEGLRKKWKDDPHLKNISFDVDTSQYTLYHNKAISSICKSLVKKNLQFPNGSGSSENSSLMSATVVSPDEQFSALFATNLIENVGKYYINTITKTARNTLHVLNKQLDSVRNQLYGAMSNVASFSDRNLNLVRQGPQVQQQKGTLKMQVNSAVYQQLVSAVETAKMSLQKETPLFEIVDKPVLPLDRQRPGKVKWGFAGTILGIILSAGWLMMKRVYREIMISE
jgi:hypothetical protein